MYQVADLAQSYSPMEYHDDLRDQVPVAEAVRWCKPEPMHSLVEADQKMLVTEEEAILVENRAVLDDKCSAGNGVVAEAAVPERRPDMATDGMTLVVGVRRMEKKRAVSVAAAAVHLYDGRVVGLQTTDGVQGLVQGSPRVGTAARLENDADWKGKRHFRQAGYHSL